MKNRLFYLFLALLSSLRCEWDELFIGGDDPSIVEHVSVISGNLNLAFEDALVLGPEPLSILRTYSSGGAQERSYKNEDLKLKKIRKTLAFDGGWTLLPHLQMLIDPRNNTISHYQIYLSEPSGALISYTFQESIKSDKALFKPEISTGQSFGILSGRTNPRNHLIKLNFKKGKAKVYLANGGYRKYVGKQKNFIDKLAQVSNQLAQQDDIFDIPFLLKHLRYYTLVEERLPSGRFIYYTYNKEKRSLTMSLFNPRKQKCYSSFTLRNQNTKPPFFLIATTSDNRVINYAAWNFKNREYLDGIYRPGHPIQHFNYTQTRHGVGASIESYIVNDTEELRVEYFCPPNEKKEKKWLKHPYKKPLYIDKVKSIKRPSGITATFYYEDHTTYVRDAYSILTKYHHTDHHLTSIEYFKENDELVSSQVFFWDKNLLIAKAMCNAQGEPLFSKTYEYDDFANVTKETLYGNITGLHKGPFTFGDKGALQDADIYTKFYYFDPITHLLIEEREDQFLKKTYSYKPGTDLLTEKCTFDHDKLILKESFLYDEDHLISQEIIDDGAIQKIKRYTYDHSIALITSVEEVGLNRIEYTYSDKHEIIQESVYNNQDNLAYSIKTEYDEGGRIIKKTTPLKQSNTYEYTPSGDLSQKKEKGFPAQTFQYDKMHRPILSSQNGKSKEITYDLKGRITSERDFDGNLIEFTYDAFSRCIQKRLPAITDLEGKPYQPILNYAYDIQGNLAKTTDTLGNITSFTYTTLQKPLLIHSPNGAVVQNIYDKSGRLKTTLYPDGSYTHYEYDIFDHLLEKKLFSSEDKLLSNESWSYQGLSLVSYTDPTGLKTTYTYDNHGRLLQERTLDRQKSYSYDALGYLNKIQIGEITSFQNHDVEGHITSLAQEGLSPLEYEYDSEGRKTLVHKMTPEGKAIDSFFYDDENRLIKHIDPLGHTTLFSYDSRHKTTIDPEQNRTIFTFDALGNTISIENQDKEGRTLFLEEFFYDGESRERKRLSHIYEGTEKKNTLFLETQYDTMGNKIGELENGKRLTEYFYDLKGRLIKQVAPNRSFLTYTYDPLDRITSLKSDDGSIDYAYIYDQGLNPIQITDLVQNKTLFRTYNPFGELITEISLEGHTLSWSYDNAGRVTEFILPDHSKIKYLYDPLHLKKVERISAEGLFLYDHRYSRFDINGHVTKEKMICHLGSVSTHHDLLERVTFSKSSYAEQRVTFGPLGLINHQTNSLTREKRYTYDPLQQIASENETLYHFDSLSNPENSKKNDFNELLQTELETLSYDDLGNLIHRSGIENTEYTYDPLQRLTSIVYPQKRRVVFSYDPLSRLSSKRLFQFQSTGWKLISQENYLYDPNYEIGTVDNHGVIKDLKVLGLSIEGDIGAAIAIEKEGSIYAPLHDLRGNIIALVRQNGTLIDVADIDAFGVGYERDHLSPWGFSSKRQEEGLFFFGKRFYDPLLKRWLTPDPLGFADSRNPYQFVLNNPLNRLDLFGLTSIKFEFGGGDSRPPYTNHAPSPHLLPRPPPDFAPPCACYEYRGKAYLQESEVECIFIHRSNYTLNYSPEEEKSHSFDLINHLDELMPQEGNGIGLIVFENGMNSSYEFFRTQCHDLASLAPDNVSILGIYNQTRGFLLDSFQVLSECRGQEDTKSKQLQELSLELSQKTSEFNKDAQIHFIVYSQAAAIYNNACRHMEKEEIKQIRSNCLVSAMAPAFPPKKEFGKDCVNYVSTKDYLSLWHTKPFLNNPEYDIRLIACLSKRNQMRFGFVDHNLFDGVTYFNQLPGIFKKHSENYGYGNGKHR